MAFPERVAIASRNAHKLRELGRICARLAGRVGHRRDARPAEFPDVEETEDTYLGNALLKARAVAEALGVPAIADDSGIEVDALGGKPGPPQRPLRGGGRHRRAEPRRDDAGPPRGPRGRSRRAVPVRGRARVPRRARPCTPRRTCEGTLVSKRRGERGFGYDPIFVPAGWDETMAELTDEQKDRISHRGRAFRALGALLAT